MPLPPIRVLSVKPIFGDPEWYGDTVEFEWAAPFDFAAWRRAADDEERAWFDAGPRMMRTGPWPMERAMADHLAAQILASPEWRRTGKGAQRFDDWELGPRGGSMTWSERDEDYQPRHPEDYPEDRGDEPQEWEADESASEGGAASRAHIDLEGDLREYAEMLDASRLVKPPGLRGIDPPAVFWFQKARVAVVETTAATDDEAAAIGERLRRNLVPYRALTSSDVDIHHVPLYVGHSGGAIRMDAVEEEPRDTEKQDARRRILRRGQDFFGARGISIAGHDGEYTMELRPYLKHLRGKFATARVARPTLEGLGEALDEAIRQIEARL